MTDGDLINKFRDYQIEWLTSHNDIDLHETEMWVVQFLRDTAECFVKTELPSAEKTTINSTKTTITGGDLISRDSAIVLVNYALAENKDALEVLENIPSAEKTTLRNFTQQQTTDGDLISRKAVIDIVEFECGEWKGLSKTIVKEIEQLPSAEKTAEWIFIQGYGTSHKSHYKCSNCEYKIGQFDIILDYNFCPKCGAKMKGDKE